MTATGINLSAFGRDRRPLLAVAQPGKAEGEIVINLTPATMFEGRINLHEDAAGLFAKWRQGLHELPRPIGVDVAIDLTALGVSGGVPLWRLTHRPLDYAFYGDAPLTDKVGEFGVRFRAMLADGAFKPGRDIIEAAPRATMELLEFKGQYIGGSAHHGGSGWKADNKSKRGDKVLAAALMELGVNPGPGVERVNSDDLDAMLCALTALAAANEGPVLAGDVLGGEIAERAARRGNAAREDRSLKAPNHCAVLAGVFWSRLTVNKATGE